MSVIETSFAMFNLADNVNNIINLADRFLLLTSLPDRFWLLTLARGWLTNVNAVTDGYVVYL